MLHPKSTHTRSLFQWRSPLRAIFKIFRLERWCFAWWLAHLELSVDRAFNGMPLVVRPLQLHIAFFILVALANKVWGYDAPTFLWRIDFECFGWRNLHALPELFCFISPNSGFFITRFDSLSVTGASTNSPFFKATLVKILSLVPRRNCKVEVSTS